ncbi:PD-(D/E)XK nuclease family protein [Aliarcobacter cryaerophilus]|uniref:PD-(D/E)XK nuclease family protein n=1 Tax=Aliarcobacter cryaerophilus TaxID=28198 RepID=UPI0021B19487|nr:PD-(D/E)XK nuclease family protein [Aliarcobacter cryaerophilus]MCT7514569.1 PD-(D/E)XK nuclease family protein [Aliarcobacter cryaerophilus]
MENYEKYEELENFIFDDNVQDILDKIKNSVMNFNILEITGMGSQEIKHSNILAWMFSNSEHNLEYKILEDFLKKIVEFNEVSEATTFLKHYIYLPEKDKNITIYREKDNIDLLIVDNANKVVIAIENKVYANERSDGKDGGQLKNYCKIVDENYKNFKNKIFIYLTIDGLSPESEENQKIWLNATHEMIGEAVEDILEKQTILPKAEMILTSYVDLLKRRNIMSDKNLEELCKKIWDKNSKALDILFRYRTTNLDKLYDLIASKYSFYSEESSDIKFDAIDKIYKYVYDEEWYDADYRAIDILIVKKSNYIWIGYWHPEIPSTNNKKLLELYKNIFKTKPQKEKRIVMIYESDIEDLTEEQLSDKANETINTLNLKIEELEKSVNKLIG